MKTNILLTTIAMICFSTTAFSGGKQEVKADSGEASKGLVAWTPELHNRYQLSVLDGKSSGTVRILIEGMIRNESILSIINLKGQEQLRCVIQPIDQQREIEMSYGNLKQGVYFLKIDSGDEIRLKKLLINPAGAPLLVTSSIEG